MDKTEFDNIENACKMEPKIDITPKMIDAGVMALFASDRRVDSPEEIISKIYAAIIGAKG